MYYILSVYDQIKLFKETDGVSKFHQRFRKYMLKDIKEIPIIYNNVNAFCFLNKHHVDQKVKQIEEANNSHNFSITKLKKMQNK